MNACWHKACTTPLCDRGYLMIEQLKFYYAALRVAPLGVQAAVSAIARAVKAKPPALKTSCEPIILMHGIAGFREIDVLGLPLLEYFTGVRQYLAPMGYRVFAPEVAPFDDPVDRARQWLKKIEEIRKQTGAEKVHLVGHSQGGLDARALVAPECPAEDTPLGPLMGLGYGPRVRSLTTISTPHLGSAIADEFEQDSPVHKEAVDALYDWVGLVARAWTHKTQDVENAVRSLSHWYITKHFNRIIQDDPQVPCFAVAGDPLCRSVVHHILRPTYDALNDIDPAKGGGPNDSLVTVPSAFFGNLPPGYTHLETPLIEKQRRPHWKGVGLIQADHIAEVGLELRLPPSKAYDHLAFFAGLAQSRDPAYTANMTLMKDGRWERTAGARASAKSSLAATQLAS
jgi:pimeloyl-ACP methyl ester carboxylesterase